MKKIIAFILSLLVVTALLCGCKDKTPMLDNDSDSETVSNTEQGEASDTEQDETSDTEGLKLSSVSIGGVDISKYRIVYATSFSREQCFEDMKVAADMLNAELDALLGSTLSVVPDTEERNDREIILGVALRPEWRGVTVKTDEYCVKRSGKKLLLGADCLAGVVDACEVFVEYLKEQAANGNADVDIADGFDMSGKKHVTRVLCAGDSITQGVCSNDEIKKSYPAQLQKNLGIEYDVMNYGRSGATLCSTATANFAERSYINKSQYYDDLLRMAPYADIVVIMFGANDAMGDQTIFQTDKTFEKDYTSNLTKMVSELRAANSDIKIIVFGTTTSYRADRRESNLVTYVRPLQKKLANDLRLDFFDMGYFSKTVMTEAGFEDGLHPNADGYEKMGIEAARVLKEQYNLK